MILSFFKQIKINKLRLKLASLIEQRRKWYRASILEL